ncbi:MAG: site-specific integrase [Betaproteobacteria bacterium]|nr:site-specific integrase [Betaproteobacteria bacterium]
MAAGSAGARPWARLHLRAAMVLLGTGLRAEELLHLPWRHVDLAGGAVHIRAHGGWAPKERREKTIPLPAGLLEYLRAERAARPGETWLLDDGHGGRAYPRRNTLTAAFARHLAAIGAPPGVKPLHGFRALYASTLHQAGVDVATIQQLMGHRQIAVTQGYLADPSARARDAVARLTLPAPAGNTLGNAPARKIAPR